MKKRYFYPLLILFGACFIYFWLAVFGNEPQQFSDVVHELTSMDGSNKSAERDMVYILSALGVFAICVFRLIYNSKNECEKYAKNGETPVYSKLIAALLFTSLGCGYLIYKNTDPFMLYMAVLYVILLLTGYAYQVTTMVSYITIVYALCGIYRTYVLIGGSRDISTELICFASFLICCGLIAFSKMRNSDAFTVLFPFIQLFVPLTLAVFLASGYKIGAGVLRLDMPSRIMYPVLAAMAVFTVMAAIKLKKCYRTTTGLEQMISIGTPVCILCFNSYSGLGQIVQNDLHHPFENIIAYSRIFEMGQVPYTDFIPVSGLYSVVQGAFFAIFGKGEYSFYNVTENLFYLAVAVLLIWLLDKHIKRSGLIFFVLLFPLLRYNRIALILPVMLLLSWPALIEKRNLWIKLWFLTSLIHGLYYPLYGAAVCIAFMPLLVLQIIRYAKEGLLEDLKKPRFYAEWLLCLLPAVLSIPLLMGTLRHMLAMSAQTVFADGLSRFGQVLPADFFSYIHSDGVRILLYYLFSFMLPIAPVWLSAATAMRAGNVRIENKKLKADDPEAVMLFLSFGIAMFVSFSYTLIRIDTLSLYARSAGMIYASAIMLILLTKRYLANSRIRLFLSAFAVFMFAAVMGEGVRLMDADEKLCASYTVEEDDIFVSDRSIPRLGNAFIKKDTYEELIKDHESVRLDPEGTYMGLGDFGLFYLFDIKGGSVMETMTVRGFNAAKETVDSLRACGTEISPVDSLAYYYLYKWLMCSGEYAYDMNKGMFTAAAQPGETGAANRMAPVMEGRDAGLTPASWGSSADSLCKIMEEVKLIPGAELNGGVAALSFEEGINGADADFIYIELDGSDTKCEYRLIDHVSDPVYANPSPFAASLMKKIYNPGDRIEISWKDDDMNEHSMQMDRGRGKLLIPLGAGAGWLFNKHYEVYISMISNGEITELPPIKEAKLYRLREVL